MKLGILKESWCVSYRLCILFMMANTLPRKPDFAKRLANRIKAFHQFKSEIGQKVHAALEEKEQYAN